MYRTIAIHILSFLIMIPAAATALNLPDTGQTVCFKLTFPYDITACAGTGQDGEYSINPMSYTDNDNGTVTDNNTGLMWQRLDNDQTYNWYKASGTYHATENPTSQDVCGASTLAGHSDWRLPTKKELVSIVDFSVVYPGPNINQTYFPSTELADFWSSIQLIGDPDSAWSVYFGTGSAHDSGKINKNYVRCVRGVDSSEHGFHNNGDGTVTDMTTGLIWQQDEPLKKPWANALSYCSGLSLGDSDDWRLPNIRELESLADETRLDPAIHTFFPNAYAANYWSSTTNANSPYSVAWYVSFYNGYVGNGYGKSGSLYVRCVRSGPVVTPGNLLITFSGTGEGKVSGSGVRYGVPAAFSIGVNTLEQFDVGTVVSLHGEESEYSIFSGWSGACSGASDCALTMTANIGVTADFDFDTAHKARIGDTSNYFSTLQGAYNAVPSGQTVKAWGTVFIENLTCGAAKEITLEGGYNGDYSGNSGYTTLQGNLTVQSGSFILERLVIQ
jgi:hypothetical protein